jgi:phosphoglycolate phosphatase-like HAD superfamily hydrolase
VTTSPSHRTLGLAALVVLASSLAGCAATGSSADPLPSWQDGATKHAILAFVDGADTPGDAGFIPPAERVAVFDNDGTLWAEQPLYFQLAFALDRVRELAPQHPEWEHTPPFDAVLENDLQAVFAGGEHALLELVMATHSGLSTEEFEQVVTRWLASARHPSSGRPYTAMVYQPMLELLEHLRARGFRTWIVSGGGLDFMRPWTQDVYGIPPEQVVGSSIDVVFEWTDDGPRLMRQPALDFLDDKEGKPVAIHRHIGRRPVFAFGNSDGDLAMLQWTVAGDGPRFAGLVRHTDGEREWAYDRESSIGRLDKALDQAQAQGWTVVDMASDWRSVFPEDD